MKLGREEKPEKEEGTRKLKVIPPFCPIRSTAGQEVLCKRNCQWFNEVEEECSIKTIATSLKNMKQP